MVNLVVVFPSRDMELRALGNGRKTFAGFVTVFHLTIWRTKRKFRRRPAYLAN